MSDPVGWAALGSAMAVWAGVLLGSAPTAPWVLASLALVAVVVRGRPLVLVVCLVAGLAVGISQTTADAAVRTALVDDPGGRVTLVGTLGADGRGRPAPGLGWYARFHPRTRDGFDWDGAQAREALDRFGAILDRQDPQAAGLSWDQAAQKLAEGGCGFMTLNDSAYGELVSLGATEGEDFGQVAFPGTDESYVAVVDTFVQARQAANAANAADLLAVIGSAEAQLEFNKVKGSVPVRTDVDTSSMSAYQQSAAQALRSRTVLWSIVHGSAMSPQFQQAFYDAVDTYVRSRDTGAFNATLTDALNRQVPAK